MNKKLIVLSLLDSDNQDPIEGFTMLTKIVFLYQQETDTYEYAFVSGQYGPFSQQLYDDVLKLEDAGYIDIYDQGGRLGKERNAYEITEKGRKTLRNMEEQTDEPTPCDHLDELKLKWNDVGNLWDLLDHVHDSYPDMAKRSILR